MTCVLHVLVVLSSCAHEALTPITCYCPPRKRHFTVEACIICMVVFICLGLRTASRVDLPSYPSVQACGHASLTESIATAEVPAV